MSDDLSSSEVHFIPKKKQPSHSFCLSGGSKSLRIDEGDPEGAQTNEQQRTTLPGCWPPSCFASFRLARNTPDTYLANAVFLVCARASTAFSLSISALTRKLAQLQQNIEDVAEAVSFCFRNAKIPSSIRLPQVRELLKSPKVLSCGRKNNELVENSLRPPYNLLRPRVLVRGRSGPYKIPCHLNWSESIGSVHLNTIGIHFG